MQIFSNDSIYITNSQRRYCAFTHLLPLFYHKIELLFESPNNSKQG